MIIELKGHDSIATTYTYIYKYLINGKAVPEGIGIETGIIYFVRGIRDVKIGKHRFAKRIS